MKKVQEKRTSLLLNFRESLIIIQTKLVL